MGAAIGNKYAEGNEGGRPSKYKEEYAEQAYKLCLLGHTDADLAKFFEVDERTINNWKEDHNEFLQSLKNGKESADAEVAKKLYKRAIGYQYDEVTFEKNDSRINLEVTSAGEMKQDESYKKKIVTKEVAPDTTAQIFWLKNRQPKLWREKTENVNNNLNYNSTELTPDEIKKIDATLENEV